MNEIRELGLLETLEAVDYTRPVPIVVEHLKQMLATVEPWNGPIVVRDRVVLVGGGSGIPTVARSLQQCDKTCVMMANTGEIQKNKDTRETVGAGVLRELLGTIDWIDIVKQSVHGRRERNAWHKLLDRRVDSHMRVGYLVFEAARQTWGLQKAIDTMNAFMDNPYRVVATVETPCEARYVFHGKDLDLYDYALRKDLNTLCESIALVPETAVMCDEAKHAIAQCRTAIVGPGDVHFSVLFHFVVPGFREALARVDRIVLITNLTARSMDIRGFKLSNLLDLYAKYLPEVSETIAIVNNGAVVSDEPLLDDLRSMETYGRFRIWRAPISSRNLSNNAQLIHDEALLATVLGELV